MNRRGLLWGTCAPLMDAAGDGEGSGGGAGAGAGAGDGDGSGQGGDGEGDGDGGSDDDKPVTMKALRELLGGFKMDVTKQVNAIDKKLKTQGGQQGGGQKPAPQPQKKAAPQFEDPEKEELRQRLETQEKERATERQQMLNRERDSEIKSALAEFPWKDKDDRDVAFDYYRSKAERDEDGNLVIGDVELGSFIKKHAPARFRGMFAPRDVGGSGNSAGKSKPSGALDLSEIKPGMSPETDAKARETISALFQAARSGQ